MAQAVQEVPNRRALFVMSRWCACKVLLCEAQKFCHACQSSRLVGNVHEQSSLGLKTCCVVRKCTCLATQLTLAHTQINYARAAAANVSLQRGSVGVLSGAYSGYQQKRV